MPLQNFGSILNFAEEIESLDRQFYAAAGGNPACAGHKALFAQLEAEAARNVTTVQRIRRENVKDFVRAPFCEACEGAAVMAPDQVLATARKLESRAARYYAEASGKLKALTEVSRALKLLGKARTARLAKLNAL